MRERTRRRLREAVAARAGCSEGYEVAAVCAYCGTWVRIVWPEGEQPTFRNAHLDHVIPESRNGPTSLDNTVIACAVCNSAKGSKPFGDPTFLAWLVGRRATVMESPDFTMVVDVIERYGQRNVPALDGVEERAWATYQRGWDESEAARGS